MINNTQLQIKSMPQAIYPLIIFETNKKNWVDLKVVISPAGELLSSNLIATSVVEYSLVRSALRTIQKWKFSPPISKGIKENITSIVRVKFKSPKHTKL